MRTIISHHHCVVTTTITTTSNVHLKVLCRESLTHVLTVVILAMTVTVHRHCLLLLLMLRRRRRIRHQPVSGRLSPKTRRRIRKLMTRGIRGRHRLLLLLSLGELSMRSQVAWRRDLLFHHHRLLLLLLWWWLLWSSLALHLWWCLLCAGHRQFLAHERGRPFHLRGCTELWLRLRRACCCCCRHHRSWCC